MVTVSVIVPRLTGTELRPGTAGTGAPVPAAGAPPAAAVARALGLTPSIDTSVSGPCSRDQATGAIRTHAAESKTTRAAPPSTQRLLILSHIDLPTSFL